MILLYCILDGWGRNRRILPKFLHFTTCSFACSAGLLLLCSAQVPWARDRPVYAHRSKDKYLDIYVSCESHWALIYYLLTVWVLNQEVDFNLDLNWGFRSNLTRRFFIPYLSCCKCSLTVIIFARYIFWNKGGFGWSIGKMAYLVTGSHWHKS